MGIETIPVQKSGMPVNISGHPVTVSGNIIQISGQAVDIVAEKVAVSSGKIAVLSGDIGAQVSGGVQVSGEVTTYPITKSGDYVVISGEVSQAGAPWTVDTSISGNIVDISGQKLQPITASGDYVVISGEVHQAGAPWTVDTSVSGNIVQISGQGVSTSVSGDIVNISGQAVDTSVSGNIVDITQPTTVLTDAVNNPLMVSDSSGGDFLTSSDCISVVVKTLSANATPIYLGGSTGGHMPYSGHGLLLEAGEAVDIDIDNTGLVHACAATSGDQVSWIANN